MRLGALTRAVRARPGIERLDMDVGLIELLCVTDSDKDQGKQAHFDLIKGRALPQKYFKVPRGRGLRQPADRLTPPQ